MGSSSSSSQALQPMQGLDRLNHEPPSISIHDLSPPVPNSQPFRIPLHPIHPSKVWPSNIPGSYPQTLPRSSPFSLTSEAHFLSFRNSYFSQWWVVSPPPNPPTWRTRVPLLVWIITFDLSGKGDPTYQQQRYRRHNSQDHLTAQTLPLLQSADTFARDMGSYIL